MIPTTTGVVEILLLTEEDPGVGRSVACIGGTTQTADIDAAYHAFVDRPTGVIERLFGPGCYRIDISGRIDGGSSWQLGVLIAHALHASGRLAQEHDPAEAVIWATGTVRAVNLAIGEVGHVAAKLRQSVERLRSEAGAGRQVCAIVPAANASEIDPALKTELDANGIELLAIAEAGPLWDLLNVRPTDMARTPICNKPAHLEATAKAMPKRRFSDWRFWTAAGIAILFIAGLAGLALWPHSPLVIERKAVAPRAKLPIVPLSSFKDCDDCPEMVTIPPGEFLMGSPVDERGNRANERPQHPVRLAAPFAIGRYEVTIDQFAAFVDATGYQPARICRTTLVEPPNKTSPTAVTFRNPGYPTVGSHPAACVSWNDARAYAAWLAKKTGMAYRLPSEAEWEYAARAGTTTAYPFGEFDPVTVCDYVKFADAGTHFSHRHKECDSGHGHGTAPVGKRRPNAWGLYDMVGNVREWVEDCYHQNYVNAPSDGSAWFDGGDCSLRLARGGSWAHASFHIRAAARNFTEPSIASDTLGFRITRTIDR